MYDVRTWRQLAADLPKTSLVFNAALSDERAATLLDAVTVPPDGSLLDLGCGWGELLLRALPRFPLACGLGIDWDESALARARAAAAARKLATRVAFECADLRTYAGDQADVVFAIGIGHVSEDPDGLLDLLYRQTRRGGSCLFADGFWTTTPTAGQRDQLGVHRDLRTLDGLVAAVDRAGFTVSDLQTAADVEMQNYASVTFRDLREMSIARSDGEAVRLLEEQQVRWRDVLLPLEGFAYLVLRRPMT